MAYKEYYVAFIDILGFSKFVEENNFKKVLRLFNILNVENKCANPSLKSRFGLPYDTLNILVVSDSIILSIEKAINHSLDAIIWMCAAFQASLLLNNKMIMRGAICCGKFYINGTVLFGQAYLEAYRLERKYSTPRIIIDKAIDVYSVKEHAFITKDNTDGEYFVDYMELAMRSAMFKHSVFNIKESIIFNLIKHKSDDIYTKYDWLKDYYNKKLKERKEHIEQSINPEDIK